MNKNNIKYTIIIVLLILVFIVSFYIIKNYKSNNKLSYDEFLKDYKVNEYITSYVSDEDMAKIYLKDYIHTMYSNVEKAYDLLDEDYKKAKYQTLESYKNFVNNLTFNKYEMIKYYKQSKGKYLIFGVYDNNGNFFAFKTNGVMQYSVYLDDYTVEIG